MTTEFLEGDLVEAVKGERILRDRVIQYDLGKALCIGEGGATIDWHERNGFTLTLIERPKPKVELPTEPGVYTTPFATVADHDEWHYDGIAVHMLNTSGRWVDVGWGSPDRDSILTRLESRADTAKAILHEVEKRTADLPFGALAAMTVLRGVATEFGVTDA